MFNLLPDNLKNELKSEYKRRWVILVFIFIIFLQVSLLVFVLPTWTTSKAKEQDLVSDMESINETLASKDASPIAAVITQTNLKLNIISATMQYPALWPIIDTILSKKISSIHIDELGYGMKDKTTASITLGGTSSTRDDLVNFVKNLSDSGVFKKVDLPVSNFTKDKNIDFSISMTVSI